MQDATLVLDPDGRPVAAHLTMTEVQRRLRCDPNTMIADMQSLGITPTAVGSASCLSYAQFWLFRQYIEALREERQKRLAAARQATRTVGR